MKLADQILNIDTSPNSIKLTKWFLTWCAQRAHIFNHNTTHHWQEGLVRGVSVVKIDQDLTSPTGYEQ